MGQILGFQNEIRYGIKTGDARGLSYEAQSQIDRLHIERRMALARKNVAKKAAAPPGTAVEDEVWVDDWYALSTFLFEEGMLTRIS